MARGMCRVTAGGAGLAGIGNEAVRVPRPGLRTRGRIVETGGHEELMAREGIYHRLYQLQSELETVRAAVPASA